MCILLNVKKHEKTFALNVDIFSGVNNGQKTIDIRPHTRYNIDNLIRKQCYDYRIFSENGSHKYEFAGTEWLNPQGDSVTHLSARGA